MGILDELQPKRTHSDRFFAWLETQPKKEQEEWLAAIKSPGKYSIGAICRALAKRGFEIDENAMYSIRKKLK